MVPLQMLFSRNLVDQKTLPIVLSSPAHCPMPELRCRSMRNCNKLVAANMIFLHTRENSKERKSQKVTLSIATSIIILMGINGNYWTSPVLAPTCRSRSGLQTIQTFSFKWVTHNPIAQSYLPQRSQVDFLKTLTGIICSDFSFLN